MVHAALTSLLEAGNDRGAIKVMAIFDNEETGSGTKQGAASPVLRNILKRICNSLGWTDEAFMISIASSFMISADNAHAVHPNYVESRIRPIIPHSAEALSSRSMPTANI